MKRIQNTHKRPAVIVIINLFAGFTMMPTDQDARQHAIDPTRSFIVQAPAGSGKTELLTQRFLKLLSCVNEPEEIIAITFTRKAAAEMRQRIMRALARAEQREQPSQAHQQYTFELALAAQQRDDQCGWHLSQNPNRLRILTIDALASFLSGQIPLLAGFGASLNISQTPINLYREAVHQLFDILSGQSEWHDCVQTLLLHLDAQIPRVVDLLCQILAKREQWLSHLIPFQAQPEQAIQYLESTLSNVIREAIQSLLDHIEPQDLNQLIQLAQFANEQRDLPPISLQITDDPAQLHQWQQLARLLLTKSKTPQWRKSVTKAQGFPAKSPEKAALLALLEKFQCNELLSYWIQIAQCPPHTYPASQQAMICALAQILPLLSAQLHLVFQQHSTIDYVELNLAACRALGEADNPTDLALYLDHQIQHLLIDEFQDTSITQFNLIEQLITGWEPGDGRTLFLVGDPMQSIYRFRDADVGLFLRAEEQGLQQCTLEKLTLTRNFRSDKAVVDWINSAFSTILPATADITAGAVPYSPAVATQTLDNSQLCLHLLPANQDALEAQAIVNTIQSIQQQYPDQSIAILVRSRAHLHHINTQLAAQHMHYTGVDLAPLAQCGAVLDAMTLVRALLHREDRTAWLALLRTPICGITLADCHAIATASDQLSIWQSLQRTESLDRLSADGQQRVQPLCQVLARYFAESGQKPLHMAIEGTWRSLGFDQVIDATQHQHVATFFKLVSQCCAQPDSLDIEQLQEQLELTYQSPPATTTTLSIMTIHKAKGLEFDHVILPGLHRTSGQNKQDILRWLERPTWSGTTVLMLAPIKPAHQREDAIYQYLDRIEKQRLAYETDRLLYVAATRVKRQLHGFACADRDEEGQPDFKTGTFAYPLRNQFNDYDTTLLTAITPAQTTTAQSAWRVVTPGQSIQTPPEHQPPNDNPLPSYESPFKRHLGTVIHSWLADPLRKNWSDARWRHQLLMIGIHPSDLPTAFEKIQQLQHTIANDDRAQWILNPDHEDSQFEFPITVAYRNRIRHQVIDRTFVDHGTRWIIDYKTALPEAQTHDDFLQHEWQQYQPQLQHYANTMKQYDNRPTKIALYFPLFGGWITEDQTQQWVPDATKTTYT